MFSLLAIAAVIAEFLMVWKIVANEGYSMNTPVFFAYMNSQPFSLLFLKLVLFFGICAGAGIGMKKKTVHMSDVR